MINCRSVLLAIVATSCTLSTVPASSQTEIRSLTERMVGHGVGGVTVDLVGNIYVADFGNVVWKITPDGERREFASDLYGASGNAIDNEGNLLQSNCYSNSIVKIDRKGHSTQFVTSGLSCPVGIAVSKQTGEAFVANCSSNSIASIATDGTVSVFAKSELFKCPNGLSFGPAGNLYVVNFKDNKMLKLDPKGVVTPFATVSGKGLGHLCFKDDRFYVTAYHTHEIYVVTVGGIVKRILGNGTRGVVDGADTVARLSFPNGIGCHPWAPRLYVNELLNDSTSSLPPRSTIREIVLDSP